MSKRIAFINFLETVTSYFRHDSTAPRQWTFQDRDGKIADLYPTIVMGTTLNRRHVGIIGSSVNNGTQAPTINTIVSRPMLIDSEVTIDKLSCEVTTGATGKIIIGIYNSDGIDNGPGSLLVTSGELSITAPGVYEGLSVASIALKPGMYWISYCVNTANTFRTIDTLRMLVPLGLPSTLGATYGSHLKVSRTYDGTLPNPITAGSVVESTGNALVLTAFRAI